LKPLGYFFLPHHSENGFGARRFFRLGFLELSRNLCYQEYRLTKEI
jgi:hypothetical protein